MTTRIALITGAGQGLGKTIAIRFAMEGITPILVGRTEAKLNAVYEEIVAQGGNAVLYAADVSESAQVEALKAQLESEFDHLDILINCAGESLINTLHETDEALWDRVHNINLKAPYRMCRAMLPLIRQSQNGSIINIVSKVALKGYPGVTAYTAAKTGLLGFTRALAAELREEEIRVVAICPGPMDTPMRWNATPDYDRKLVIDTAVVTDTIWQLVNLPRGTTSGEVLLQSMHYD
jgi:NAD(P)-dependent dehydrogenase (short-subunit alcohol dehydrogenase family)